jgi:hypothetical protein
MDNLLQFDNVMTQIKLGAVPDQKLTVDMLQQVPIERLYTEGFRNWDGSIVLLPLWALAVMQTGESLKCIDNSVAVVGTDEIDDDTRGGCIAYGVPRDDIPKKEIA